MQSFVDTLGAEFTLWKQNFKQERRIEPEIKRVATTNKLWNEEIVMRETARTHGESAMFTG